MEAAEAVEAVPQTVSDPAACSLATWLAGWARKGSFLPPADLKWLASSHRYQIAIRETTGHTSRTSIRACILLRSTHDVGRERYYSSLTSLDSAWRSKRRS